MASISDRLKEAMRIRNMKQADVVKASGVNKGALSSYIAGRYHPKQNNVAKLAKALNVNELWLLGQDVPMEASSPNDNNSRLTKRYTATLKNIPWNDNVEPAELPKEFVSIPVLGSVPAGVPVEAVQDIIDTIEVPADFMRDGLDYVALRVDGDSMYPMYLEGDVVLIELRYDCESGQDAVVYVNGYDATLKTVVKNDNGTITLHPRNPEWVEKTYGPGDSLRILGPVVNQFRSH